MNIDLNIYIN